MAEDPGEIVAHVGVVVGEDAGPAHLAALTGIPTTILLPASADWLWGPLGLVLSTPLTVCLVVIGTHVPSLRLFPIMFGDKPVLADSARLYDRLLAGRSFEFTEAAATSTAHGHAGDPRLRGQHPGGVPAVG